MKIIRILSLAMTLTFFSCGTNKRSNEHNQLIKDYAFCRCFDYSINDSLRIEFQKIDYSKSMLFDIGDLGLYYKKIDSLALLKSKSIKASEIEDYKPKKPIIAECLSFSRSKEIDVLIKDKISKVEE